MPTGQMRPISDQTIINVLRYVRAQIIRDGLDGLGHVEALLQARGDNLGPVPRKAPPQRFRRGKLRAAICTVLREGPLTGPQIVERIAAAHELPYGTIYRSAYTQLGHMRRAGRIAHEGALWRLGF